VGGAAGAWQTLLRGQQQQQLLLAGACLAAARCAGEPGWRAGWTWAERCLVICQTRPLAARERRKQTQRTRAAAEQPGSVLTSMFTRSPTVVARPTPPPPDESYRKVGYAPIASALPCRRAPQPQSDESANSSNWHLVGRAGGHERVHGKVERHLSSRVFIRTCRRTAPLSATVSYRAATQRRT